MHSYTATHHQRQPKQAQHNLHSRLCICKVAPLRYVVEADLVRIYQQGIEPAHLNVEREHQYRRNQREDRVEGVRRAVQRVEDKDTGQNGDRDVWDQGDADSKPKLVPNLVSVADKHMSAEGSLRRVFPVLVICFLIPPLLYEGVFDNDEDDEKEQDDVLDEEEFVVHELGTLPADILW
jgi:hypothetical protein